MDDLGNLDAGPEGQDWLKGAFWDLPTNPQQFFDTVIGGSASEWEHFKTLPVFAAMPPKMAAAVERLVYGNQRDRAAAARRSNPST